MTINDSFGRALWKFKKSLEDFNIKVSGTESRVVVLNVVRDKYSNEQVSINVSGYINVMFDFPNDEIPTSLMSTNSTSQSNSNVLHMYDIIPIQMFITNEAVQKYNITKDSVILYKIKMPNDDFNMIQFQITDASMKGNASSGITWCAYTVAPLTNYELANDKNYIALLEQVKLSDKW